jgi:hypothetical protein
MYNTLRETLVGLQIFQLAFLLLHDWIPLGPLNDLPSIRSQNTVWQMLISTIVSSVPFAVALVLSMQYLGQPYPIWIRVWLWLTYGLRFVGELQAWWIPYLFRADARRAARYQAMFGKTHTFLPQRNGIAPDTLHVLLHLATTATLLILGAMEFTA